MALTVFVLRGWMRLGGWSDGRGGACGSGSGRGRLLTCTKIGLISARCIVRCNGMNGYVGIKVLLLTFDIGFSFFY